MGVWHCDRSGCDHVMPDRHSHRHGHICEDCFAELVSKGPGIDYGDFMDSFKGNRTYADENEALEMANVVFKLPEESR